MTFRLLAALGLVIGGTAGASEATRPNVLFLLADDLGWGDVGFNGRASWATPNLDRLAQQGARCHRFYTAAVVCAPSRAALLTGKNPIHNGVSRNEEDLASSEVTIAEALRDRGYATALAGKWHHGRPAKGQKDYIHPLDQGFGDFFGFTDAVDAFEKFPDVLYSGRERKQASGFADDLFADFAVEYLKGRRGRPEPFFLEVSFTAPHFSIEAPEEEMALHRGRFSEADPSRPVNAAYAALVTRLDRNVGRVLAALEASGLAGNTLVVFTSDHGATFESGNQGASAFHDSNRPFRGQKRTLWEGGVRIPTVVRWPDHVPAGSVVDGPGQTIDLLPTFLAAAGGVPDAAWGVDGVDLTASWTGLAPVPDRTLFFEWRSEGADQVAAIRGDLKLVVSPGIKPELFDVAADPGERIDVAAQHPGVVRQLRKELKAWLATEVVAPNKGGLVR